MRKGLVVPMALAAVGSACVGRAAAQGPTPGAAQYQTADTAGRPVPEFAWVISGWDRALRLPALRSVSLPAGRRELRAWIGFGLIVPGQFVRIVQAPDTTVGRLVMIWDRPVGAADSWLGRFEGDMQALYRCPVVLGDSTAQPGQDQERACVARRPRPYDWRPVLDSLDALGVWTVRNSRQRDPLECSGLDGISLVVELLDGARYHTWCSFGGARPLPAGPIMDLLQRIPSQFADPVEAARLDRKARAEEARRDSLRRARLAKRARRDSLWTERLRRDSVARAEQHAWLRTHRWPPAGFRPAPGDSSMVWIAQHADSSTAFRGLSAPNDTTVWASGSNGVVARSVDGGRSWITRRIPGADSLFLVDVSAFDDRMAVVLGTSFKGGLARIFRTNDGGVTWQVQYTDDRPGVFYDGLACWDAHRCVAFGDPVAGRLTIVRTEDGVRWRRVTGDAVPAALPGEAGFAASGTAITVAGAGHAWIGTGGGRHARVYRTADGGRTWQVADTPLPAGRSAGIFGIAFEDTLHGLAVGGDYTKPDDPAPNVLRTDDGGRTWRLVGGTTPPGVKWGLVAVPVMKNTYVVVSPAGTGFTTDDGATWTAIAGAGYNTVVFVTPAVGWVAGDGGRIARASSAPHP